MTIGSGGFRPGLVTHSDGVQPDYSVLASEHAMFKKGGITLDASLFVANADGEKIAPAGLIVGEVTTTGKYGPYLNTANDGREVAAGILVHAFNVTQGDVIANLLIHGSVYAARVSYLDSGARADLAARIIFQ